MDRIREIVGEVERALGVDATPEQVESVAALVLERMGGPTAHQPLDRSLETASQEGGIVTAAGPNGPGVLAILSNVLADSGAIVEEVSQASRNGVFVLAIRCDLTRLNVPLAELRKRLQAAAARQDVRVSLHRADLYAAMTTI